MKQNLPDVISNYVGRLGQLESPIRMGDFRVSQSNEVEEAFRDLSREQSWGFNRAIRPYYYASALERSGGKITPNMWRHTAAFLRAMGKFNKGNNFLHTEMTYMIVHPKGNNMSGLSVRSGFKCPTFTGQPVREWKTRDVLRLLHYRLPYGYASGIPTVKFLQDMPGDELPAGLSPIWENLALLQDPTTPAGLVAKLVIKYGQSGLTFKNVSSRMRFDLGVYDALLLYATHLDRGTVRADLPRLQAKGMFKDDAFVDRIAKFFAETRPEVSNPVGCLLSSLIPDLPRPIEVALIETPMAKLKNVNGATVVIETPMSLRTYQKALAVACPLIVNGTKNLFIGGRKIADLGAIESFRAVVEKFQKYKDSEGKATNLKGNVIYLSSELKTRKPTGGQSICIALPRTALNKVKQQPPTHLDVIGIDQRLFGLIDYWLGRNDVKNS